MNSYFNFLGRDIPAYGVMFFCGIFISAIIAVIICKRRCIERYDIVYSAVYAVIGGIAGAKLLFLAVSIDQIIELKISIEAIIKGGFVFYGGLIGGAIGLYIYSRQFKLDFLKMADVYAVVFPLGHAIGRIGCHFAGCCYGIEYDGPFCIIYTETIGNTPLGVELLPIQLIEAAILIILFIVLYIVYRRSINSIGKTSFIYVVSYACIRFALEFFRGDKERGILLLSTSQWISISIIAFLLILRIKKAASK